MSEYIYLPVLVLLPKYAQNRRKIGSCRNVHLSVYPSLTTACSIPTNGKGLGLLRAMSAELKSKIESGHICAACLARLGGALDISGALPSVRLAPSTAKRRAKKLGYAADYSEVREVYTQSEMF